MASKPGKASFKESAYPL